MEAVEVYQMYCALKAHFAKGDYDFVKYNGNIYPRKDINGKDMIKVDGQWKEAGEHSFPWEEEANNGNKNI